MLRLCFRLASQIGTTVTDLARRVSWVELTHWIAYYTWEADQALPASRRPIRPRTPDEAADAMDRAFGIRQPRRGRA